ncbi:hypothetical protein QP027_08345 [Corynebacterium breve]|uniref:Uncharacterized protein n=1 Tax=Corynebacterium breve TaxID=3049799 RepID=A0ABY8VDV6_9CORY|nr:hypothetical protein [Corynebacterium breve]WIM67131.1 hypothetical protein QP027_08345 [Corynebacterium breve]
MQAPNSHEQADLTAREHEEFDLLASCFEVHEEHVLDPSLMFYICE